MTKYYCTNCEAGHSRWSGYCGKCKEYNTIEKRPREAKTKVETKLKPTAQNRLVTATTNNKPVRARDVEEDRYQRVSTGMEEFDRVLGGGIVQGAAMLLAGPPGAGKSTVLAAVAAGVAKDPKRRVLYVSGEESESQIISRHKRVGADADNIYVLSEANAEHALAHAEEMQPDLLIIDSLQNMVSSNSEGRMGSPSQVVEVCNMFTQTAKQKNIPVLMIGHITKTGEVGGPKTVEHTVDVVLYLEASNDTPLRLLRGSKNRFGVTDEIGTFQHTEDGLEEITDPSGFFTSPHADGTTGYATGIMVEGLRAIPAEIQALSTDSDYPNPRKLSAGMEHARSLMVQAVLDKHARSNFGNKDVYVSTVNGVTVKDPALDLALVAALLSSTYDVEPEAGAVYIGEVSLTGEIRKARFADKRKKEAQRLGFQKVYDHTNTPTVAVLAQQLRERM